MAQLTDALGHRAHRTVHAPRTGLEECHGDESEYGGGQHDTVKTERELRNPRGNRCRRRGGKVPGQTECPQQRDHFAQAGCTGCDQIGGKQHVEEHNEEENQKSVAEPFLLEKAQYRTVAGQMQAFSEQLKELTASAVTVAVRLVSADDCDGERDEEADEAQPCKQDVEKSQN